MARPRASGGTSLTLLPSINKSPAVISSRPAIMRSKVDLPQPEGPTKTMNSRSRTERSRPFITSTAPYCLLTAFSCTVDMAGFLLDGAEGWAAHELALGKPAEDHEASD